MAIVTALVTIRPSIVWWGLLGGVVAFAVVLGYGFAVAGGRQANKPFLPPGATWKWSDSWASNLTAIITALGTVAAFFSGKLKRLVDQDIMVTYGLTTAVLLVVAACAPLAYAACQSLQGRGDEASTNPRKRLVGTWYGWCLASALTVAAVEGSLAAGGWSIWLAAHGALRWTIVAVPVLIAALVFVYAARTFHLLLESARSNNLEALTGIIAMPPSPVDEQSVPRMTLL
jgi:hypothetical protein